MRNKTKQNKTKQNKKQNKTKQNTKQNEQNKNKINMQKPKILWAHFQRFSFNRTWCEKDAVR